MPGAKRFGELKKSIGSVSQKVLTSQLRDMEKNGLVNRKAYAEAAPRGGIPGKKPEAHSRCNVELRRKVQEQSRVR